MSSGAKTASLKPSSSHRLGVIYPAKSQRPAASRRADRRARAMLGRAVWVRPDTPTRRADICSDLRKSSIHGGAESARTTDRSPPCPPPPPRSRPPASWPPAPAHDPAPCTACSACSPCVRTYPAPSRPRPALRRRDVPPLRRAHRGHPAHRPHRIRHRDVLPHLRGEREFEDLLNRSGFRLGGCAAGTDATSHGFPPCTAATPHWIVHHLGLPGEVAQVLVDAAARHDEPRRTGMSGAD